MACAGVIRLGDEKTSLELLIEDCQIDGELVIVDITNATSLIIRFKRQDNTIIEKAGVIYTGGTNGNGTDGIAQYVTEAGFITEIDIGTLQAIVIVEFADGSKYHSSKANFKVKDNF